MSTKRTDRTGIDRNTLPQDTLVRHEFEANAQAIISISQKRLCFQASKETREEWINFLEKLKEKEPELYNVCVPSCVYRCGCPEFESCNLFNKLLSKIQSGYEFCNIESRYKIYHELMSAGGKNEL